jgi:hypothetical protein
LFTLHTLFNAVICCSQLNTCGVLGLIPRGWIISHSCSWMAVYVSCCNAQSKSHSDSLDISRYLYSINCPTIICLPSMCYFILWRDTTSELWTLVLFPLYCYHLFTLLALFTFSHITIAFHSIRSYHCFKQTGEIDNLIISWEHSIWLCCVQVPHCRLQSKAWTRHLINCPELSRS